MITLLLPDSLPRIVSSLLPPWCDPFTRFLGNLCPPRPAKSCVPRPQSSSPSLASCQYRRLTLGNSDSILAKRHKRRPNTPPATLGLATVRVPTLHPFVCHSYATRSLVSCATCSCTTTSSLAPFFLDARYLLTSSYLSSFFCK